MCYCIHWSIRARITELLLQVQPGHREIDALHLQSFLSLTHFFIRVTLSTKHR